MCPVNPRCVGRTFDDAALCETADTILNRVCILEIVNFNVGIREQFSMLTVDACLLICLLGPTIYVRGGTCHIANSRECPQLSQGTELAQIASEGSRLTSLSMCLGMSRQTSNYYQH